MKAFCMNLPPSDMSHRKLKYVGHAIRNEKTTLMASVFQGKTDALRKRGRPKISYTDIIEIIR